MSTLPPPKCLCFQNLLAQPLKDHRSLCPGSGAARVQASVRQALNQPCVHSPCHGLPSIRLHPVAILIRREICLSTARLALKVRIPEQNRRQLLPGDSGARAEGPVVKALDNPMLLCPSYRLPIIGVRCYIRKGRFPAPRTSLQTVSIPRFEEVLGENADALVPCIISRS